MASYKMICKHMLYMYVYMHNVCVYTQGCLQPLLLVNLILEELANAIKTKENNQINQA